MPFLIHPASRLEKGLEIDLVFSSKFIIALISQGCYNMLQIILTCRKDIKWLKIMLEMDISFYISYSIFRKYFHSKLICVKNSIIPSVHILNRKKTYNFFSRIYNHGFGISIVLPAILIQLEIVSKYVLSRHLFSIFINSFFIFIHGNHNGS